MLLAALVAFLILCLGSEFWLSRKFGLRIYAWRESVSHLVLMLGQQAMNVYTMSLLSVIYLAVYETGPLFAFDAKNLTHWGIAVLLSDLAFYFAHRLGHRVNFFVAFHGVHHQAKDYNHISAARQSWVTRPIMFAFYLPLAVIGVPASMLFSALLINLVIQFASHNGAVRRRLGILEYIFITPRTHRVHHGTNAPYLDRNFGGGFVFWDHLFGTYQDVIDSNPVRIGWERKAIHLDPLRTQWDYLHALHYATKKRSNLLRKIALWFDTPETLAKELAQHRYSGLQSATLQKILPNERRSLQLRSALYFGLIFVATLLLVVFYAQMGAIEKTAMAVSSFCLMGLFGRTFSRLALSNDARENQELDACHAGESVSRSDARRAKLPSPSSKTPSRISRLLPRSSRAPSLDERKEKSASQSAP